MLASAQGYLRSYFKEQDWTSRDDRIHTGIRNYVTEMLGDPYPFVFRSPDVRSCDGQ